MCPLPRCVDFAALILPVPSSSSCSRTINSLCCLALETTPPTNKIRSLACVVAKDTELFKSDAHMEQFGPDFPFVELPDNEPDAYKVVFRNKQNHNETVECKDLQPPIEQSMRPNCQIQEKIVDVALGDNLSPHQRRLLLNVLASYMDVFCRPPGPWIPAKVRPHVIRQIDREPVRQPHRKVPFHLRDEVEKEIAKMLKRGIVRPSRSPYLQPLHVVRKASGEPRVVLDLRLQNSKVALAPSELPTISSVLESLKDSKFLSVADGESFFNQIPLSPDSCEKVAFMGVTGLVEYVVLPFGAKNASFTAQRTMNTVLAGLQPHACLAYIDDVVICGATFEQHLRNLELVLERFREAGLYFKMSKCTFGCNKIKLLGHIVGGGIAPDPDKTAAISKLAVPKTKKDVLRFTGAANFYRKFIRSFSLRTQPLIDLTRKDAKFEWKAKHQEAFENIKKALTSAPVLAFPSSDKNRMMVLACDASGTHIGGVLQQQDENGDLRVLQYVSKRLNEREQRYMDTQCRETYAIVWCVNKLSYFLLGAHFRVVTDSKNLAGLRFVFNSKDSRLAARFALLLSGYSFEVVAVPGSQNKVADALSRLETVNSVSEHSLPSLDELRVAQLRDVLYARIFNRLKGRVQPDVDVSEELASGGKYDISKTSDLLVHFAKNKPNTERVVIPPNFRWCVFCHFHFLCAHAGRDKTYALMSSRVFWRGMSEDIAHFIKQCEACQRGRRKPNTKVGKLRLFNSVRPFQCVGIDIFGPLPITERGNMAIVTLYDRFTRWVEYVPTKHVHAQAIAEIFQNQILLRFGCPETVLSDRGQVFLGQVFRSMLRSYSVEFLTTASYTPSTNGATERSHAWLAACMKCLVDPQQKNWDLMCPFISWAARVTISRATKHSSYFLLFGREPSLPTEVLFGRKQREHSDSTKYALETEKILRETHALANKFQKSYSDKDENLL